jgi:replicative DNA helicase
MATRPDRQDGERILPHNLEAERSVLGAILLYNENLELIAHGIKPASFFRKAHAIIYAAMLKLSEQRAAIDLVTMKDALARAGDLDEVGGPAYISALVDGVPRSLNIGHYAGIVHELAIYRALVTVGNKMVEGAYQADTPATEILETAESKLLELQGGHIDGTMATLAESNGELIKTLDYRIEHKGELTGVPSGFGNIDGVTMGWQCGDMVILAARPSIGKTAFAVNAAIAAAQAGVRCLIFSLEMTRESLELRMLSALSGVDLTRILTGYIRDNELPAITEALTVMNGLPISIDDGRNRSIQEIRSLSRRERAKHGAIGLVMVDYIQLMRGTLDRRGITRNEEMTDISRRLKALAGELGVPLLVLSQLNRGAEGRSDPRPRLADLRESGALEQDADMVCFLHRKNHREGGLTNFIIDKQRTGPGGTVNLMLDRDRTMFTPATEADEAAAAPKLAAEDAEAQQAAKTKSIIARRAGRRR